MFKEEFRKMFRNVLRNNAVSNENEKRPAKDDREARAAVKFYDLCREQIRHEDGLVNQRLVWFITLQGFLFTAYGFSMSGEGGSLNAAAFQASTNAFLVQGSTNVVTAVTAYSDFKANLYWVRHGLAILGYSSSFIAMIGVLAAFRAIKAHVEQLADFPNCSPDGRRLFLEPTGPTRTTIMGVLGGILIPFFAAGGWLLVGHPEGILLWSSLAILCGALLFAAKFTVKHWIPSKRKQ